MLFNLQPDQRISGGAWYSDDSFDSEFVEVLNQQCYRMLHQRLESAEAKHSSPLAVKTEPFALAPGTGQRSPRPSSLALVQDG